MFTFFILFLLLSSVFVSPGSTNKNFPPFEKQITSLMTMRLTKVASYWLNFSFVDNRNFSFANVGFQFYVANNATDYSDGFANTPIEIKGSEVNYYTVFEYIRPFRIQRLQKWLRISLAPKFLRASVLRTSRLQLLSCWW